MTVSSVMALTNLKMFVVASLMLMLLQSAASLQEAPDNDGEGTLDQITSDSATGSKPNFVLIQVDDQARWDTVAMNKTLRLLADEGITLTSYMVNTPICCPSRAELFAGRYYHNVGAPSGNCMHVDAEEAVFSETSLFSVLQANGYQTGVFGKVTNDQDSYFCSKKRTDGMSVVGVPCPFGDYYATKYFVKLANGTSYFETLQKVLPTTYQTAQLGNRTIAWIREITQSVPGQPFLAYVGPHAPHLPSTPAAWHETGIFDDLTAPRTPSWNQSSPDKHEMIAGNPPLDANGTAYLDHQHQIRQYSLLSVDDLVDGVYNALQELKLLDKTYIIFTSDHGYHLGQWRVPSSKRLPYDTDIFVTTLVRGPGIAAGTTLDSLVGNVDVTPTILELASLEIPKRIDGRSVASQMVTGKNQFFETSAMSSEHSQNAWREMFLIQYVYIANASNSDASMWFPKLGTFHGTYHYPPAGPCPTCPKRMLDNESNSYRALRLRNSTHNLLYAEFNLHWTFNDTAAIFYEFYDLSQDPYQLSNAYNSTPVHELAQLRFHLDQYSACAGSTCP